MVQCSQAELILRQPVRQGLLVEVDCNEMQEELFNQEDDACSKQCLRIMLMAASIHLLSLPYLHDLVDHSPIGIRWMVDCSND